MVFECPFALRNNVLPNSRTFAITSVSVCCGYLCKIFHFSYCQLKIILQLCIVNM